MKRSNLRKSGFTFVELMIVLTILGLLVAIVIPNYLTARNRSQAKTCISNLRELDCALQQWAFETHKSAGDPVTLPDLEPYVGRGMNLPNCPSGGGYSVTDVSSLPLCTIGNTVNPAHEMPL